MVTPPLYSPTFPENRACVPGGRSLAAVQALKKLSRIVRPGPGSPSAKSRCGSEETRSVITTSVMDPRRERIWRVEACTTSATMVTCWSMRSSENGVSSPRGMYRRGKWSSSCPIVDTESCRASWSAVVRPSSRASGWSSSETGSGNAPPPWVGVISGVPHPSASEREVTVRFTALPRAPITVRASSGRGTWTCTRQR
jgi:hypothetical protein